MARALIGHTGFVGGHCARQAAFDDCFNSRNIEEIAGRSYDLVVCCGAPAEKWRANREPETDRQCLDRLMRCLGLVQAKQVILISTVDVFPQPAGVDEATPIDLARLVPYGKHRRELELFLHERFPTLIVRLPGLFGAGLKKNVIYDLLHDHNLDRIHCQAVYQFYDLENLWRDITIAWRTGLDLIHFATEPVSVAEVAAHAFGRPFTHVTDSDPVQYDLRTRYAALFGGSSGYLQTKEAVLDDLRRFVTLCRKKKCA